jgi:hypothetical protein
MLGKGIRNKPDITPVWDGHIRLYSSRILVPSVPGWANYATWPSVYCSSPTPWLMDGQ